MWAPGVLIGAVVLALISFAIPAWSIQGVVNNYTNTSDLEASLDSPNITSGGGIILLLAGIAIVVLCIAAMASRSRPVFLAVGILGIVFGAFIGITSIVFMAMQPDENCPLYGNYTGCGYGYGGYGYGYGGNALISVQVGPGLVIMLISGILTLAFAIATLAKAPRLMYAAPAMYAAPMMYQS